MTSKYWQDIENILSPLQKQGVSGSIVGLLNSNTGRNVHLLSITHLYIEYTVHT